MAFNGNGVFNRLYSWVQDAINGIKIRADRMDNEMNGMATGLSTCITTDGQSTVLADLNMNGFKLTEVGAATVIDEYMTMQQIQEGAAVFGVNTGTAEALVMLTSPQMFQLVDGQQLRVRATGVNTDANVTIDMEESSSSGAHPITLAGGAPLPPGAISGPWHELELRYELANTRWVLLNPSTALPVLLAISLTNVNIAALAPTSTIDGVALAEGDLVLLNGQTVATQNGSYVIAAAAPAVRSNHSIVTGVTFSIKEGTYFAGSQWQLQPVGPIIIATTPIAFAPINSKIELTVSLSAANLNLTGATQITPYDTVEVDSANWWAALRYTPKLAGRYLVTHCNYIADEAVLAVGSTAVGNSITLNGVAVAVTRTQALSAKASGVVRFSSIVSREIVMNGTTDYIQSVDASDDSDPRYTGGVTQNYMQIRYIGP